MTESIPPSRTRTSILQLFRYGIVGIGSNIGLYVFYLLITSYAIQPRVAAALSYVSGATIAFLVNRQWTFAYRGNFNRALVRYAVSHLLGFFLNFLIIHIFFERLGYAHQLVQGVAVVVVAGFLFVAFKYFVFPSKELPKG